MDTIEEQRFTTWRNPTPHAIRVDVYESPGRKKRYTFAPGAEAKVPSEHDRAIHDTRDGIIVGGLAPLLERATGQATLHPSLDPEESARQASLAEAEKALLAKRAADEVLAAAARPKR